MAKKFSRPTLAEIAHKYLGMHKQRVRAADYEKLQDLFTRTLMRTRDGEEIRAALALDTHRNLPVQMKSPAYERLLTLEGRNIRLLREYAQEMYEFGPEFADYADRLWVEAKQLEEQAGG